MAGKHAWDDIVVADADQQFESNEDGKLYYSTFKAFGPNARQAVISLRIHFRWMLTCAGVKWR